MGFIGDLFKPDIPEPAPAPRPPTETDPEVEKAKRLQRMMTARRTGYRSMFASSGAGVMSSPIVATKRLLGE